MIHGRNLSWRRLLLLRGIRERRERHGGFVGDGRTGGNRARYRGKGRFYRGGGAGREFTGKSEA